MYKSLCLDVKQFFKKNNIAEFHEKVQKLPAKLMKMYNILKAEISAFDQEFPENEFNLDKNKMNSKFALLNRKITSVVSQLEEFMTSNGIEVTKRAIPPKINLTEMVSVMLNNLALEIPQKSKENAKRKTNAKYQAEKRANETDEEKQARRDKEAKAQALKRSLETEDERETRLQSDRDSHWQKRKEQFEVVGDYALRLKAAKEHRRQKPWECDLTKPLSIPYLNEAEKKAVEDYLDRRETDTKRRRALKDAMSEDELQTFLDKNAKTHRDRRAAESEQRIAKWVNKYETYASNSVNSKSYWLAMAEKEKSKHQSLRAPDSRTFLSQESSAM